LERPRRKHYRSKAFPQRNKIWIISSDIADEPICHPSELRGIATNFAHPNPIETKMVALERCLPKFADV
jgi:hypothetical protein